MFDAIRESLKKSFKVKLAVAVPEGKKTTFKDLGLLPSDVGSNTSDLEDSDQVFFVRFYHYGDGGDGCPNHMDLASKISWNGCVFLRK